MGIKEKVYKLFNNAGKTEYEKVILNIKDMDYERLKDYFKNDLNSKESEIYNELFNSDKAINNLLEKYKVRLDFMDKDTYFTFPEYLKDSIQEAKSNLGKINELRGLDYDEFREKIALEISEEESKQFAEDGLNIENGIKEYFEALNSHDALEKYIDINESLGIYRFQEYSKRSEILKGFDGLKEEFLNGLNETDKKRIARYNVDIDEKVNDYMEYIEKHSSNYKTIDEFLEPVINEMDERYWKDLIIDINPEGNEGGEYYMKDYVMGEDRIEGIKNHDLTVTEYNVENIFSFNTNRDLFFEDGSFVEKGTSFVIDQVKGDEVEAHFEAITEVSKNIYNRNDGIGDGYYFTIDELKEFSDPSKEGIERLSYNREDLLRVLNNDISLSEKEFIKSNYGSFEKFIDAYIKDMDEYKQHGLDVYKENVEVIEIQEYINHEIDVYNENLDKDPEKNSSKDKAAAKEIEEDNIISYEIEYKSVYEYPDCEVLKNKLNIKDANLLDKVERSITTERIFQLQDKPIIGNFDYEHLSKIHKYIFKDVYDWAGKPRNEEISKGGTPFAPSRFAVEGLKDTVFKPLKKDNYCKGMSVDELSDKLGGYYCELNFAHPFREGNGRTQREFIRELAAKNGFDLNWEKADPKALLESTIQGTIGREPEKAIKQIAEIIKGCFSSLEPDKDLMKGMDKILDIDRGR